jgi:hypothetical protein
MCVSSIRALDLAAEKAVAISRVLRPTTGRYFLWGDDGATWCRCPKCKELSDSDQALIVENRLLRSLRGIDGKACLAHLCYENTFPAPAKVKPDLGVFLEFAPLSLYGGKHSKDADGRARAMAILDANLAVFSRDTAQVLEYWLDCSAWSGWKKPAVELTFEREGSAADLREYRARGIRHITTFAVYMDAEYAGRYGMGPVREYGNAIMNGRHEKQPQRRGGRQ